MSSVLKIITLEERVVFDAALAAVIADVTSSHSINQSGNDAQLLHEVNTIPGIHTLYVKEGATGANDGSSWRNAYTSLDSALAAAAASSGPDQILVAQGTYHTTTSFNLPDGVAIFGGYKGEGNFSQARDPNSVTYLTGVVGKSIATMTGATVIMDGINMSNGKAPTGGAIQELQGPLSGSNLLLFDMYFSNNRATSNNGGGAVFSVRSQLYVMSSDFVNNIAPQGGAIRALSDSKVILSDNNFTGNHASSGGAVVEQNNSQVTYENNSFIGNTGSSGGGAITSLFDIQVTLSNNTFTGNTTNVAGGAITVVDAQQATFSHDTFTNNSAGYGSGAINLGGALNSVIDACTFTGNTAAYFGGAIGEGGSQSLIITNSTFIGNSATIDGGPTYGGGALNVWPDGYLLIQDNLFENNSAYRGGAIVTASHEGPINILNNSFINNSATLQGGAIWDGEEDILSPLIVTSNYFSGNTAPQGPAIWLDGTQPSVNGDPIMANWLTDLVDTNNNLLTSDIYIL